MKAPISLAPSARRWQKALRSLYLAPTHSPCNSISMKSLIMSLRAHTPSCCSISAQRSRCRDAGWHTTDMLNMPKNITPIFLPSRSPELNPVENIWQYLRANWLSNRVFETYDDIIDAACQAWHKLIAQPQTITSIGMRE